MRRPPRGVAEPRNVALDLDNSVGEFTVELGTGNAFQETDALQAGYYSVLLCVRRRGQTIGTCIVSQRSIANAHVVDVLDGARQALQGS